MSRSQPPGGAGLLAGVLAVGEQLDEGDVLAGEVARLHQDDILPAALSASLQVEAAEELGGGGESCGAEV